MLVDFKERNTSVTGKYYALVMYKLNDAITEKFQGKLSRGGRLLHDSVSVHTVIANTDIQQCGFQKLNHSSYSSDLDLIEDHLHTSYINNAYDLHFVYSN